MQIEPNITIFDTEALSREHPLSPEGVLYTSYVSETRAPLHYHDFFEIGYCEKGNGVFIVDGEPVPFHGRSTSIVYEGQVHIAQSASADRSLWHFLYIDLNYLYSGSDFFDAQFLGRRKSGHWQDYDFPNILPQAEYPAFYELSRQIHMEAAKMQEGALDMIRGLTYALLTMHERLFVPCRARRPGREGSAKLYLMREVEPALNYINEHLTEEITVEDLVEVSTLSKSNLQRKMIALTGKAPLQYVHYLRMKYACALLLERKHSMTEIAGEVGYNVSSFNRQFHKEFGKSPSEWRKSQL